jgi:hypothetical protein
MQDQTRERERQKRHPVILQGISEDLKHSKIASQLGVNRWVIVNDLTLMRREGDPELKEARRAQALIQAGKQSVGAKERDERFVNMTGMTLQEKSFQNMIEFFKTELMNIMNSSDQNAAIMRLPKSTRRPLVKNGIITKGWHNRVITPLALEYLVA